MSNKSIKLIGNTGDVIAKTTGSKSFVIGLLVVILFLLVVGIVSVSIFANNVFNAYKHDDKISWVKLDPNGNWTVTRTDDVRRDYYSNTVNASLKRLLTKCFSSVKATINNDWAVCMLFLSDNLKNDFIKNNFFVTQKGLTIYDYLKDYSKCSSCAEFKARVVSHDHKNEIPTSLMDDYGENRSFYESVFYIKLKNLKSDKVTKLVVNLQWSFMSYDELTSLDDKNDLVSINEALVESPLGIYFNSWEIIEDKS